MSVGQRAVACPGFRWLPGMRWTAPIRPGGYGPEGNCGRIGDNDFAGPTDPDAVPDTFDPATVGCLLALVRARWDDPEAYVCAVEYAGSGPAPWWRVFGCDYSATYGEGGATEAESLIDALESAP